MLEPLHSLNIMSHLLNCTPRLYSRLWYFLKASSDIFSNRFLLFFFPNVLVVAKDERRFLIFHYGQDDSETTCCGRVHVYGWSIPSLRPATYRIKAFSLFIVVFSPDQCRCRLEMEYRRLDGARRCRTLRVRIIHVRLPRPRSRSISVCDRSVRVSVLTRRGNNN